ncbi:hypothetical protein KFK09_003509 [Dendrobium nobile]|uniref:Bidirectional sugar transporter SWEET n=1 Tax=Dendrobium nobile TaxID=94219 RepID=A0A8T3C2S1_DENNO|nr:hypothetical protein KFK09_003509 [Dendrobium nobile]
MSVEKSPICRCIKNVDPSPIQQFATGMRPPSVYVNDAECPESASPICQPILTFKRVIQKRSTGEYSCIPYLLALFNCLNYTWYGLPIVSYGWENISVVTVNGAGVLLEFSFIIIYIWFSSIRNILMLLLTIITVFLITAFVSKFKMHDHETRRKFVGSIGTAASIAMYASPLAALKQVIATKSVEFMPFHLSFFTLLATSLWIAYGFVSHDYFIAAPNFVGFPLGIIQLVVYGIYRRGKVAKDDEEANTSGVSK